MKNICINTSNLHSGGGVQVAVSFIDELARMNVSDFYISVYASTEVDKNIKSLNSDVSVFKGYEVIDTFGLTALKSDFSRRLSAFDLVFTIFGPAYLNRFNGINIVGFAQPWIVYPDNEIFKSYSFYNKIKSRLRFFVQSYFFRRSTKLVVELEHVKRGLVSKRISGEGDVHVVYNAISSLYKDPSRWKNLVGFERSEIFSIGFLGRDYPHKNTRILPYIKDVLRSEYGIEVDFYVTFDDKEWSAKTEDFRSKVFNVGVLAVDECPCFYQKMDAVIFPSFLECFSATPLEAMMMERPLFASDRGFVRDVCGDFAFYFDPNDPRDAALKIASYIAVFLGRDGRRLGQARKHVEGFSSSHDRALQYVSIVRSSLGLPC